MDGAASASKTPCRTPAPEPAFHRILTPCPSLRHKEILLTHLHTPANTAGTVENH